MNALCRSHLFIMNGSNGSSVYESQNSPWTNKQVIKIQLIGLQSECNRWIRVHYDGMFYKSDEKEKFIYPGDDGATRIFQVSIEIEKMNSMNYWDEIEWFTRRRIWRLLIRSIQCKWNVITWMRNEWKWLDLNDLLYHWDKGRVTHYILKTFTIQFIGLGPNQLDFLLLMLLLLKFYRFSY